MTAEIILGLDVGSRHVGVAIADRSTSFVFPREAWDIKSVEALIDHILAFIAAEDITMIVVGMPVGMSGEKTGQTTDTEKIVEIISQKVSIPVIVYDERLTSKLADTLTKGLKAGTQKHSIAAQKLLEDFLQNQRVEKTKKEGLDQ